MANDPTSLELKKVMYVTQNMANRRLQRNNRKLVEAGIGGIRSNLLISLVMFRLGNMLSKSIFSSIGMETLKNFLAVRPGLKRDCSSMKS